MYKLLSLVHFCYFFIFIISLFLLFLYFYLIKSVTSLGTIKLVKLKFILKITFPFHIFFFHGLTPKTLSYQYVHDEPPARLSDCET